jgi:putative endonuclease
VIRAVGDYGERMARGYLTDAGLTILETNWRCPAGEIDIVARDGACLVVVEVKTRRGVGFGTPVEQVTRAKLGRLRRLACLWLAEHPGSFADIRVDVVGVWRPRSGPCRIDHVPGVL